MSSDPDPPARVCCAYDGSIHAHWVARYAIRMARASASRTLRVIHVEDGAIPRELLARKLQHLRDECASARVAASLHSVRATRPLADAVIASLPADPAAMLLCGTRVRRSARGLLTGTVSDALLRNAPCQVLALRVVHPGLLGAPRRLLLPVLGNPGEGRALALIVALLTANAEELHLLRVMLAADHVTRHAPLAQISKLRAHGRAAVSYVERELRAALDLDALHVDAHVRIGEAWSRPVLVAAGQHRCDLVLAGASTQGAGREQELETLLAHAPCDVGVWRAAR